MREENIIPLATEIINLWNEKRKEYDSTGT